MLVTNVKTKTLLYETLEEMGLLATEEYRIRQDRDILGVTEVNIQNIQYDDIYNGMEWLGYFYPHFMVDKPVHPDKLEVWANGEYIPMCDIVWLENDVHLYGITPTQYEPVLYKYRILRNDNIVYRYSYRQPEHKIYTHNETIDIREYPYNTMTHPERCAYYMSDDRIFIPKVEYLDDYHIRFRCRYLEDIDFCICTNLAGVYRAYANQGVWLDNPYNPICYHKIYIDWDPDYPIDARFYPCIKVDRDCTIRVYTDITHEITYPSLSRLVLYPEFLDIKDPYNCDDEYLNSLVPTDTMIFETDTDMQILEKLKDLIPYFFRMWERFPLFSDEQSDMVVCDNYDFGHPYFVKGQVAYLDGTKSEHIVSLAPFEDYRDIIFYEGDVFSDYRIVYLKKNADGVWVENRKIGVPTYVIDPSYDPDLLTVIKFNALEDANIVNIGDWISEENVVNLHIKLNRFYRNLLVLRGSVLDSKGEDEKVRVSSKEPTARDQYLWFELLTNAVPEKFSDRTIDAIHIMNLDPYNVPEEIKEGAYAIDTDPGGGPQKYTEILETFYKLSEEQKNYLVAQHGSELQEEQKGDVENDDTGGAGGERTVLDSGSDNAVPSGEEEQAGRGSGTDLNTVAAEEGVRDGDIIIDPLRESISEMPEGTFDGTHAMGSFNFGPLDKIDPGLIPPQMVPIIDEDPHQITFGELFEGAPAEGDVWYEFLEETNNAVCYSDTESMVFRVNERLLLVQFEHDNITAFLFDDVIMNFRKKLGIRYIAIVADLLNSGEIKPEDLDIFYHRLITGDDKFFPALTRLYTGHSHVISLAKTDSTDYSIVYSTNICRFRMDYNKKDTNVYEQEYAWRHVITFHWRDFAFLKNRMVLFVNGRYIPRHKYDEKYCDQIWLEDFDEVINCVDILYSDRDRNIMAAKKMAMNTWPYAQDNAESIQRPERDYKYMQPLVMKEFTYKGYYDVLVNEFILNGRLQRTLNYLEEHQDEAPRFIDDMKRWFHAISDMDLSDRGPNDSRIIIPALTTKKDNLYYTVWNGVI